MTCQVLLLLLLLLVIALALSILEQVQLKSKGWPIPQDECGDGGCGDPRKKHAAPRG